MAWRRLGSLTAAFLLINSAGMVRAGEPRKIDFNRDIRPILSDACFQCHGPDNQKRKAGLRFDVESGAKVDLGGYFAIVAGKPQESELLARITSKQPSKRMPPPASAPALKPVQVELIRQWIAQGAPWQKHWSLLPPVRHPLPQVKNKAWPKNPIDYFVLARLEKEGLAPSPEADKVTLIRRVTLDLTGLPPTPAEVDAFLQDKSADAYERVVDRLLKSPRYAERMAIRWLEAARYADTNGYQTDGDRIMWRWRDWVLEAYNDNMPFDRFVLEQIAGDMLPNPTLEQKIATGFNRNHRGNSEGGVIPEEYAVEYVVDRVDTTSTVFLGMSIGCARCHDHKYDPVTQKEFYQLFAYFNNVPERGKAIKYGNSPPYIKAPTRDQQARLTKLKIRLDAAAKTVRDLQAELAQAQAKWEKTVDIARPIEWSLTTGQLAHFSLDGFEFEVSASNGNGHHAADKQGGKKLRSSGGEIDFVPGRIDKAAAFDGQGYLDAGDVGDFGFFDKFSMGAWINPSKLDAGSILSRMADTDRADGYTLLVQGGKVHLHLVKRWLDDAIRVETEESLAPGRWHHVFFTYDGSRLASGIRIYIDGRLAKLKINLDDLNQSFNTKEPFRIGAGGGPGSRFHGAIDDVRVYEGVLAAEDVAALAIVERVDEIVALPPSKRSAAQAHKLRSYYLEKQAPPHIQEAGRNWVAAKKTFDVFDESLPTSMVMEEMPIPRKTHVLIRGEYDKKGVLVLPGIPASLPSLPNGAPNNRLGFARWLIDPTNPLTARVTVNRYWQMLFGTGIVKTVEDFGSQGEWPSHPELLDWLATEFTARWDTKALLKTLVTSATYKQSSKATKALLQRDPDNRLLGRGPRVRLSAEMIRDQALYISGLLVEKLGGPSVKPYQPAGLVKELHGTDDFKQDHGADLYRRSLYTFWKRTVAPPAMTGFDAAARETCVVRETRTNTPLQALNLMNDVTFVEAARVLAQRLLQLEKNSQARLKLAFRLATARQPQPHELAILQAGLDHHFHQYRKDRAAALKLISSGEYPRPANVDVIELAAYTAVCNLILNLDEVITKE